MPIPIWAGHYIGIAFAEHGRDHSGLDCWGLARLVLAEQFGIALPSYVRDYDNTRDGAQLGALIEKESKKWKLIKNGAEKCGDLVVMRIRGAPMHIGVVLGDSRMLHIEQGIDSVIENYSRPAWEKRIAGFYRYKNPLDLDDDSSFKTYGYD